VPPQATKPPTPLSPAEVAHWLREFADAGTEQNAPPHAPEAAEPIDNPFPPGYAEDLSDGEDD
jgi:hypothetical protein